MADEEQDNKKAQAREREELFASALDLYDDGKIAAARTVLMGTIAADPTDPRPMKLLASALLHEGADEAAERMYQQAYVLDPTDLYVLMNLAEIKLRALKLAEAIPLFETLFAADPDASHPAANRGREVVRRHYEKASGDTA